MLFVQATLHDHQVGRTVTKLDGDVLVPLMCLVAGLAIDSFGEKLRSLFPGARVISDVKAWEAGDEIALLIAPVKGQARVKAKVEEYAEEHAHDLSKWPFVACVGDLLRASVVRGEHGFR